MTLRADAQRNLDRLLGAAAECFAEQGVDASVDEIARRAGVGHGTVFRRFPTKDALLAAVLASHMAELAAAAEAACDEPDAGEAFDRFVRAAAANRRLPRRNLQAMPAVDAPLAPSSDCCSAQWWCAVDADNDVSRHPSLAGAQSGDRARRSAPAGFMGAVSARFRRSGR